MSGNDNSASSFGPPISATVNDSNNHQNDETHQQRQSGIPEHGSGKCQSMSPVHIDCEQDSNSMLGTFPAAVVTQAACSKMVDEFHCSKISKGAALSWIHTTLVNALPEDLSTVEDSFAWYLSIIEDHEHHLTQVKQCGNKRSADDGEHQDDADEGVGNVTGLWTHAGWCYGWLRVRVQDASLQPSLNPYPWHRFDGSWTGWWAFRHLPVSVIESHTATQYPCRNLLEERRRLVRSV